MYTGRMTFSLYILMCSFTLNVCDGPYLVKQDFKDFRNCSLYGYRESEKVLKEFNIEDMNKNQYYTKFYCKENESI